ncbi:MAG: 4-hydroxy-tetrahydrodipicolinate synthase [Gemmataceae bacterium]|nr:4-hydroxy-tetrahydrodipicolinate synthase [Gemmataceae bacterium]MCS7270226.1 4-hydroxy-tetrahydrodipicolinate synthase [Gemmataceae bacterium]MDW8241642.1 4-hydroxy-tetrahydrodipicolinate synthase [Thermogemmata sp.]
MSGSAFSPPVGIIPPLVTPFTPEEDLDLPRLRWLIDWQLSCGVDAVFVLGTTGEFYALAEDEKQVVTAVAVAHCHRRAPVWVGVGAESTREVLRLTRMAEREGASGVSVITPYFLKPTQQELYEHFHAVADSTSLPVVLYNNPAVCGGVSIEPTTVARLVDRHRNIVGIKDSSGDLQNTIELLRVTPADRFSVLNGRDTLILAALYVGVHGAIPATGNIVPEWCVGIYQSFRRGEVEKAREYQARVHSIRTALALGTGNGVVKEAMALLGRSCGPNRRPIAPLSDDKRQQLRRILERAGLTPIPAEQA